MKRIVLSAGGICLTLCLLAQSSVMGLPQGKKICMKRTCCRAMTVCMGRCGGNGDCFTACENDLEKCLRVKCGFGEKDMAEAFPGGDDPCRK